MSQKPGKKYEAAAKQVGHKPYQLAEAVTLVQKIKFTKFDETVEVHMRLGVDPKRADPMVHGTVALRNGLGIEQLGEYCAKECRETWGRLRETL
jgi:large subunit ribosomal protein L1